jgi:hypothetical protein
MLLFITALAFAETEPCTKPVSHDEMWIRMNKADAQLAAGKAESAQKTLSSLHHDMLCMSVIVRPAYVARFARQMSQSFFMDQDEDSAIRWGLLARTAASDLAWPEGVGPQNPFRRTVEGADPPQVAGPDDKGLIVPKKGGVFLDGQFLTVPKVAAMVPHFVQVADKKGVILSQFWQDGAAFPPDLIGAKGEPPAFPKWYEQEADAAVADAGELKSKTTEAELKTEPAAPTPTAAPAAAPVNGSYVDPFVDAKNRATKREVSVSVEYDADGTKRTQRTEFMTLQNEPADGAPVTNRIFHDWLQKHPEFAKQSAVSAGLADAGYLATFVDGAPPIDQKLAPVAGVSWNVAKAYCNSWGVDLPASSVAPTADALVNEWRVAGGLPAIMAKEGKVRPGRNPARTGADITFRCTR